VPSSCRPNDSLQDALEAVAIESRAYERFDFSVTEVEFLGQFAERQAGEEVAEEGEF
jgi:hypothetical protein